jgi:hypothetical protein
MALRSRPWPHCPTSGGTRTSRDRVGIAAKDARERDFPYSMRKPLMARLITSCWICSVPSKMS